MNNHAGLFRARLYIGGLRRCESRCAGYKTGYDYRSRCSLESLPGIPYCVFHADEYYNYYDRDQPPKTNLPLIFDEKSGRCVQATPTEVKDYLARKRERLDPGPLPVRGL